jgi:hypothetical protein
MMPSKISNNYLQLSFSAHPYRLITYENNFLFSKEWNNSEECLVNNIIDKHDEIRQEFILQKLKK